MTDFLVRSKSGEKLGLLQDVFSIQWMPRYYEIGTAEIHVRPTDENISMLEIGNVIVNLARRECCFIRYKYIDYTADYPEMVVSGVFEPISERINIATEKIASVSDVATLVRKNLRGLDLEVANLMGSNVAVSPFETTWENIADTVQDVCQRAGYGFKVEYIEGKSSGSHYVMGFYLKDINASVRFSDDLGNIIVQSYLNSVDDYANFAYVAGEGDGADRVVATVDRTNGGERFEIYVDARDLQKNDTDDDGNDILIDDITYAAMLTERGESELDEKSDTKTFDVEVNSLDSLFRVGVDYDIGDVVRTTSTAFGVDTYFRITGLNIIYEKNEKIELVLREEV